LVKLVEHDPCGADGTLEYRGENKIKHIAFFLKHLACFVSFPDTFRREINIGPSSEPVLAVPNALSMPYQR
jgi:hypothetical protein